MKRSFYSIFILMFVCTFNLFSQSLSTKINKLVNQVVTLDYFFNHEIKKDLQGNEYQFHYTWEDKENSGFSELGEMLEKFGAVLKKIERAPKEDDLKNVDIYLIVDPDTPRETAKPNYICETTGTTIAEWVNNGGVLVLMGNDKGNCEFEHFNSLAEKFGIHFNEVSVNKVDGKNFDMGKFDLFPEHPVFDGIKKIYLKDISTFTLKDQAKSLLSRCDEVIIAYSNYGNGLVLAVGDPWFYNEYIDHRILPSEFQNLQATENLFKWLLAKAAGIKNKNIVE